MSTDGANAAPHTARWALVAAVALVVALVVAAIAVAANRDPLRTEPGSPEETVQRYFDALIDGRRLDALDTFTDELAEDCAGQLGAQLPYQQASRVVLDGTTVDGDDAEVRVRITQRFDGGLLDDSRSELDETLLLVRTVDGWRISQAPWPLFSCRGDS